MTATAQQLAQLRAVNSLFFRNSLINKEKCGKMSAMKIDIDWVFDRATPEPNSGCWLWDRAISQTGYGNICVDGKYRGAHRVVYEALVGPIPEGLHLDHRCRVRACVNPNHLEPVSQRENSLRGVGAAAVNARQTHCRHGHELTPENTYRYSDRQGEHRS